ncbi:MAG TPA: GNAT family N-acetyltransferase [Candidatus Limnocylindrales bacterium]
MNEDPIVGAALPPRLDRGIEGFFEEMTRRTPGGRIVRKDDLLLVFGASPSPIVVNSILPSGPNVGIDAVRRAFAAYEPVGAVPSMLTRDHLDGALTAQLTTEGFRRMITLPGMVLEARLPAERPPDGVTIHKVETATDHARWIEGNLHGFGEDEPDREAMLSAYGTLDSLVGPPITAWWAESDGRGVAASMAYVDQASGVGVVGWVGTDVAYRGRGIGRAITLVATNAAFDLGATVLSLQASPMGLRVYERLGYRTVTGYKVWLAPDTSGH